MVRDDVVQSHRTVLLHPASSSCTAHVWQGYSAHAPREVLEIIWLIVLSGLALALSFRRRPINGFIIIHAHFLVAVHSDFDQEVGENASGVSGGEGGQRAASRHGTRLGAYATRATRLGNRISQSALERRERSANLNARTINRNCC